MRLRLVGLVAILAWCALSITLGARAQKPSKPLVLYANIFDAGGKPVDIVRAEDLQMREDDVVAPILSVEPIKWPVAVSILVDNGYFAVDIMMQLRNGLKGLINKLPADVEISIQTISPQPRWLVRPTKNPADLLRGIDRLVTESSAAKFVESFMETSRRFDTEARSGGVFPVVIMMGTTGPESSNFREAQINLMLETYQRRAATVHVVLLNQSAIMGTGASHATAGVYQMELGLQLTKMTGGRFEKIGTGYGVQTILPEIGAQVALSHARQSNQHRITFERPAGKSGPVGAINLAMRDATWNGRLSLDGRWP